MNVEILLPCFVGKYCFQFCFVFDGKISRMLHRTKLMDSIRSLNSEPYPKFDLKGIEFAKSKNLFIYLLILLSLLRVALTIQWNHCFPRWRWYKALILKILELKKLFQSDIRLQRYFMLKWHETNNSGNNFLFHFTKFSCQYGGKLCMHKNI